MNSMNKQETQLILKKLGIKPNKRLGQNFLIDRNVVSKILSESHLKEDDVVLEVGPGLGALTEGLVEQKNQIYAFEIDFKLFNYLKKKFRNVKNLEIFNQDILKAQIPPHNVVISNIPYSITGAIFEKVFYKEKPARGVLIIENTIAERIFSKNTYKNFSRITVSFNAFMEPIQKYKISKLCFIPTPKIELALIMVKPKEDIAQFLLNENQRNFFLKFVAGLMPYKNKNLINGIILFLKKEEIEVLSKQEIYNVIINAKFNNKKIAQFKVEEIIELSKLIFNWLYN
jgi:16S rRNA (adenine1518-N6/adenine1519-N6)-dimethyltransferase